MDAITNAADINERWVREFMRRLGYLLAAEWQAMPECELKDMVGEHSHDIIDMVHAADESDETPPPSLRVVT
jgi:S-adenosylmethionine synthetase